MITILQIDPTVLKQNKKRKASTYVETFLFFIVQFCSVKDALVRNMFKT